jgi:hypothetical protein
VKRRRLSSYSTRGHYSAAGTVHSGGGGYDCKGAEGGRPRGFAQGRQERRFFLLISCLIRLIHLLSLYREVYLLLNKRLINPYGLRPNRPLTPLTLLLTWTCSSSSSCDLTMMLTMTSLDTN